MASKSGFPKHNRPIIDIITSLCRISGYLRSGKTISSNRSRKPILSSMAPPAQGPNGWKSAHRSGLSQNASLPLCKQKVLNVNFILSSRTGLRYQSYPYYSCSPSTLRVTQHLHRDCTHWVSLLNLTSRIQV